MSRIDDLIAELCPDGVAYRTLSEVATITGGSVQPSAMGGGDVRVYSLPSFDKNKQPELLPGSTVGSAKTRLLRSCVLVAKLNPHIPRVWRLPSVPDRAFCSPEFYPIEPSSAVDLSYLYYFLKTRMGFLAETVTGSTNSHKRLRREDYLGLRVPVPPMEVQREVVRILDTFNELEAELELELEAELETRRRQYAYYRDSRMEFAAEDTLPVPLGDVGLFIRGRRFTKTDVVETGIPSIHYGEIYTHYGLATDSTVSHVRQDLRPQLRFAQPGDVVFAAVGETVEDVAKAVAWLGGEPVAIHDDTFLYRSSCLSPKFVAYYAQTAGFHSQKNRHVARAKVMRLSGESLAKITIPVPSMAEQERIVAILDSFEKLVTGLSVALPAELRARRSQYEYYRDRLFTFRELGA